MKNPTTRFEPTAMFMIGDTFRKSSIPFSKQALDEIQGRLNRVSYKSQGRSRVYWTRDILHDKSLEELLDILTQLTPDIDLEKHKRRKYVFLAAWSAVYSTMSPPTDEDNPVEKTYRECVKWMQDIREVELADGDTESLMAESNFLVCIDRIFDDSTLARTRVNRLIEYMSVLAKLSDGYSSSHVRQLATMISRNMWEGIGERAIGVRLSSYMRGEEYNEEEDTEVKPPDNPEMTWAFPTLKQSGVFTFHDIPVELELEAEKGADSWNVDLYAAAYYPSTGAPHRGVGHAEKSCSVASLDHELSSICTTCAEEAIEKAKCNYDNIIESFVSNVSVFCGSVSADMAVLLIDAAMRETPTRSGYIHMDSTGIAAYHCDEPFRAEEGSVEVAKIFREFLLARAGSSVHLTIRNSNPYIRVEVEPLPQEDEGAECAE